MYNNLVKNLDNIRATLHITFIQGPQVEIISPVSAEYLIEFRNNATGDILHSSIIRNNHWTKCSYEYFIDWNIRVYQKEDGKFTLVRDYFFQADDKRVYIALDSKALGDTLAWMPYVEQFRQKHKCKVICSTFHNNLFENNYPEIEFIRPGEVAHNLYAMYVIGWFYKDDGTVNRFKNPVEVKNQNLQKTAADILGISFKENKPKLRLPALEKKKQIAIAIHGTAQAKYWNNPTGWQEVTDWCIENGYEVVLLSKEGDGYMGNFHPKGVTQLIEGSLEQLITELRSSYAFIGISSGLSWLSWATNTPTIIVSGFSEEYTEPESCYRLTAAEEKCSGCFNNYQLDAGDWNWCPVHKGTERQFECSKSITSESVINILKTILEV